MHKTRRRNPLRPSYSIEVLVPRAMGANVCEPCDELLDRQGRCGCPFDRPFRVAFAPEAVELPIVATVELYADGSLRSVRAALEGHAVELLEAEEADAIERAGELLPARPPRGRPRRRRRLLTFTLEAAAGAALKRSTLPGEDRP